MYANNPEQVLDQVISLDAGKEEMERAVKSVVREIMSANEADQQVRLWTGARDEDITIIDLCGGITNKLFLVEHLKSLEDSRVIVRTYGNGTDMFIDRMNENIVFSHLSRTQFGPSFHGLFDGGRIEGYIPSATLQPAQMKDATIFPKIAAAMADLHKIDIMAIRGSVERYWLWDKIKLFFKLAKKFAFEGEKADKLAALDMSKLSDEVDALEALLLSAYQRMIAKGESDERNMGRLHALEQVLCHNDLLSGNILLYDPTKEQTVDAGDSPKKDVYLIDYEYAAYNFRAYDLANHFNEFGGFEFDIVNEFPPEALRKDFIRHYLSGHLDRHSINPSFVQGVEDMTLVLCLASHLCWGSWSVVQSGFTTLDFDYLSYAKLRFDGFYYHKALFADLLQELAAM